MTIRNRAGALDVVGIDRPSGAPAQQPRKPTPAVEVTSRDGLVLTSLAEFVG